MSSYTKIIYYLEATPEKIHAVIVNPFNRIVYYSDDGGITFTKSKYNYGFYISHDGPVILSKEPLDENDIVLEVL